jgi:hypothetical protein
MVTKRLTRSSLIYDIRYNIKIFLRC